MALQMSRSSWIAFWIVLVWLFCGVYSIGYFYGKQYAEKHNIVYSTGVESVYKLTPQIRAEKIMHADRIFVREMKKAGYKVESTINSARYWGK